MFSISELGYNMKRKTLFLGNGLNRTLKGGVSWSELMRKLGSQEPEGSNVPFPIEFEQLAARRGCLVGKRHVDPYKDLRNMIVEEVSNEQCSSDSVHRCFCDLPFDHMVTTNYDRIFDNQYKLEAIVSNPGYSRNILGPIYRSGNRDFYHAHGIDKWKNTLCLGHEHYAALIGKIRKEFYPNEDAGNALLVDLVTGQKEPLNIWPELFLTNDVAIVGFGLDYCESDIWWLLALRAALFAPCKSLDAYANEITYFKAQIKGRSSGLQETCRLNALASLGVTVSVIEDSDYEGAYRQIAEELRKRWKS